MTTWKTFLSIISKIDDNLEELLVQKEIEDDNYRILNTLTIRLRDETLENLKRIQLCSDFKNAVVQFLKFSTISDQIICRYESLVKKYPKQLNNVFYDFRDPTTFKEKALEMATESFIALKIQGYSEDANPILKLLKLRTLEVQIFNYANDLHKTAFTMATSVNVNDDDNEEQKYDKISDELKKARAEISRLREENEELKNHLIEEKRRNDILSRNLNSLNEENYKMKKKYDSEILEYNTRIQNLIKTSVCSNDEELISLRKEVASLRLIVERRK